jgi:hypothetical protein
MAKQRGGVLFVVALALVAVASLALLGWPWYNNRNNTMELARAEQEEADAMRGVAPSPNPKQSRARSVARERAEKLEASEALAQSPPDEKNTGLMDNAFALLCAGCSNFDSRERYWVQQFSGGLKAAPRARLESFAATNGHQMYCNTSRDDVRVSPSLCYLIDAKSKGALLNYRGKLFVQMEMRDFRVVSVTFETSTVLY